MSQYGMVVPPQYADSLTVYGGAVADPRATLAGIALRQLNAAKSGRRLNVYSQAEDVYEALQTPVNDAGAWLKSAYWLAVAAQIEGSNTFVESAARAYERGAALAFATYTRGQDSGVISILRDTAGILRTYSSKESARQIAAMLESRADAAAIDARKAQIGGGATGLLGRLFGFRSETAGEANWVTYSLLGVGALVLFSTTFALLRRRG